MAQKIIINGVQYSSQDVQVWWYGRLLTGVRSITFGDGMDIEGVKGSGDYDVGFTQGNYKANAEIVLLKYEVDALRKTQPGGHMHNLPQSDLKVIYLNTDRGTWVETIHLAKPKGFSTTENKTSIDATQQTIPLYTPRITGKAA